MLRALALGLLLCGSLTPASAQFSGDGFGPSGFFQQGTTPPVPPPAYVGPFDALGATMPIFYSVRAASAAIAAAGTQKLYTIAASGTTPTNATCDVLVATNGGAGLTTNCSTGGTPGLTPAAYCATGGGSCRYFHWYNQGTGGTANDVDVGVGFSPVYTFACSGSIPCATADKTLPSRLQGAWITTAQPFNLTAVGSRSSVAAATNNDILSSGSIQFGFTAAATTAFIYAGGTALAAAATNDVVHAIQGTANGTSSAVNVDGNDVTTATNIGALGLVSTASNSTIMGGPNNMTGTFFEGGATATGVTWTPTQRNTLCHNQIAYFGITGTC